MENFKIMYHKYPSLKIKVKSKFYYFNRNFESFDKLSDGFRYVRKIIKEDIQM